MVIFEYDSYKKFVCDWVRSQPRKGYGQWLKIAQHLGTSTVAVSQIFSGGRELTPEQGWDLGDLLGLSDLEAEYFLLLIHRARTSSHKLKKKYLEQIQQNKEKAQNLRDRLPRDMDLDESAKSTFYSNWYYSGIRLLSSIDGYHNIERLSSYFELSPKRVREVVDFLVRYGLCLETEGRHIKMGPKRTHIEADSPLVSRHHSNWRLKGLEALQQVKPQELFYTAPMSLSSETMDQVRKDLVEVIEAIVQKVSDSPAEKLACLNIDWFNF